MTKKLPKKLMIEMLSGKNKNNKFYYWWRIKASNGEILCTSEMLQEAKTCWINCWKLYYTLGCDVTFKNISEFKGVKGCEIVKKPKWIQIP